MTFHFYFHVERISIVGSDLFLCEDQSCSTYTPYDGDFSCDNSGCIAYPHDILDSEQPTNAYYKIVITFSDKVRESNIFQGDGRFYDIQVEKNYLSVNKNISSYLPTGYGWFFLCIGGFFTILVESIVATIYGKIIKIKEPLFPFVILANIISLPVVWLVLPPLLSYHTPIVWVAGESFAFIFEGAFMTLFGRTSGLTTKQAFILSFFMNAASFLGGALILYWLSRLS